MRSDEEANPKKRKREAQDPSDPKLREFLQVMGSSREGVIADESNIATGPDELHAKEVVVPEGESDDEYEQIPLRKEKSRRIDAHPDKPTAVARDGTQRDEKKPDGEPSPKKTVEETAEAVDSEMADRGPATAAATDDDWLRSRTNRLLDLVEPEDLPSEAVPSAPDVPAKQDTEKDRDSLHSSADVTHDAAEEVATSKVTEKEDAVDAISRTSRIFVRNLPYSVTEDDLRETFGQFGTLQEVSLQLLVPLP